MNGGGRLSDVSEVAKDKNDEMYLNFFSIPAVFPLNYAILELRRRIMRRSNKKQKELAPFWLYYKIGIGLVFIASLAALYFYQSQWLIILPFAYLSGILLLLSRTKLSGWPLVALSFIRYAVIFFTLTYSAFVVLDIKQGAAIKEALIAPYRLFALVFEPTMPFSGLLLGVIVLLLFLFAYRKRA